MRLLPLTLAVVATAFLVSGPLEATDTFDIDLWLARKEQAYMTPITISADGKWLAVLMKGVNSEGPTSDNTATREGAMFETASEDLAGSEVFVVERETGKVTRPFQKYSGSYSPVWSPTETKLSLAIQDSPFRFPRLAVWSPGANEPKIFAAAAFSMSSPVPPASTFLMPR